MKIILNEEKSYEFVFNEEEQNYFNSLDKSTRYRVRGFLMFRVIVDSKYSKMKLSSLQHAQAKFLLLELFNNPDVKPIELKKIAEKKMISHIIEIAKYYKGDIEEILKSKHKYIIHKRRNKLKKSSLYKLRFYIYNPVVLFKLRPSLVNYKMSLMRKRNKWRVDLSLTKAGSAVAWLLAREEL